jgi:hypothetical protein
VNTTASWSQDVRPRSAALVAGIGLLAMAIIAGVATFGVINTMNVPGDPGATAANLVGSASAARLSGAGLVIVAILDIIVAWALYIVLRAVSPGLSLLAAWFRLAYAAVFAAAIGSVFNALQAALSDPALAASFLEGYNQAWQIALIVFGVHLGLVGYLVWKADFAHWLFGALLILAGAGYFVDGLGTLISPSYALGMSAFTFIGEVVFMGWLLIRGTRLPDSSG